jgi:hypothetical protein
MCFVTAQFQSVTRYNGKQKQIRSNIQCVVVHLIQQLGRLGQQGLNSGEPNMGQVNFDSKWVRPRSCNY